MLNLVLEILFVASLLAVLRTFLMCFTQIHARALKKEDQSRDSETDSDARVPCVQIMARLRFAPPHGAACFPFRYCKERKQRTFVPPREGSDRDATQSEVHEGPWRSSMWQRDV